MSEHELAGKKAPYSLLENIPKLVASYYSYRPDSGNSHHAVKFGTSGHRGSSLDSTFNENHILAVCQAVADYRQENGIQGPLFIGQDTHALSAPALMTAIEVFAANDVTLFYQEGMGYTPTPVISHAILNWNRNESSPKGDGVVITPSHNPPSDGGFKYNATHGGPAEGAITGVIEEKANRHLRDGLKKVKRIGLEKALKKESIQPRDFVTPYVKDLTNVVDMDLIKQSGIRIGADPMGGAGIACLEAIGDIYGLNMDIVNPRVDPSFSFMSVDSDGKIRMDCSSPYAMAGLIELKDKYDISFGNDPDFDRHGIVTRSMGLMNPNHYLSVAIQYLFLNRKEWPDTTSVGKTLVSSSMINRIADKLGRKLVEVPVGFKWFVGGLLDGSLGFAGEESAGASFLRKNGNVWSTDKDGIIMSLLAAEITAATGKDPGQHYQELEEEFGSPLYNRIDAPATVEQKKVLAGLSPEQIDAKTLAGEPIINILTKAPGNDASIGGLKVVTENGWFAARPSGTENIYKIYAESFKGEEHLKMIQEEAAAVVDRALSA